MTHVQVELVVGVDPLRPRLGREADPQPLLQDDLLVTADLREHAVAVAEGGDPQVDRHRLRMEDHLAGGVAQGLSPRARLHFGPGDWSSQLVAEAQHQPIRGSELDLLDARVAVRLARADLDVVDRDARRVDAAAAQGDDELRHAGSEVVLEEAPLFVELEQASAPATPQEDSDLLGRQVRHEPNRAFDRTTAREDEAQAGRAGRELVTAQHRELASPSLDPQRRIGQLLPEERVQLEASVGADQARSGALVGGPERLLSVLHEPTQPQVDLRQGHPLRRDDDPRGEQGAAIENDVAEIGRAWRIGAREIEPADDAGELRGALADEAQDATPPRRTGVLQEQLEATFRRDLEVLLGDVRLRSREDPRVAAQPRRRPAYRNGFVFTHIRNGPTATVAAEVRGNEPGSVSCQG